MQKINRLIATLFYVGFFPFAPGTVASLLAVGVYILIHRNRPFYFAVTALSFATGLVSSGSAEKGFGRKDPPEIVIDEFSSMLISYLFIPFNWKLIVIGFILFRLLDVFKIPPLKKIERLPAGRGIMLDDLAAGILTNILLQLLNYSKLLR